MASCICVRRFLKGVSRLLLVVAVLVGVCACNFVLGSLCLELCYANLLVCQRLCVKDFVSEVFVLQVCVPELCVTEVLVLEVCAWRLCDLNAVCLTFAFGSAGLASRYLLWPLPSALGLLC